MVVINLIGKTEIADFMVIASGSSQRHINAMAEHLRRSLKNLGVKKLAIEGRAQCDWVLIDAGDIIIHIFRQEIWDFYNLEKIWATDPSNSAAEVLI
ncbi:MAG: ribosome silencing factor [Magnetovibrio sp.]|nr:ribosome silencing factor [Magnetovibrio sp.]